MQTIETTPDKKKNKRVVSEHSRIEDILDIQEERMQ
jgi:hypothetical protein